jgi:hypothetical protein
MEGLHTPTNTGATQSQEEDFVESTRVLDRSEGAIVDSGWVPFDSLTRKL